MPKSIGYIQEDTKGMTYEDFEDNRLVRQAVERNLEIIGEALNKIPEDIRNKYPEVPWREIVGVRKFVIHQYFQASQEIEWSIVTEDLGILKEKLLIIREIEVEE